MEKRNGSSPSDLPYLKKSEQQYRKDEIRWLEWAKELQFIAQAGLTYSRDDFDLERFARIREISAEIMAARSRLSLDEVKGLFCNETGFQTPKIDTRGVIFRDGKILLVKEKSGGWSLPGGWMDVNQTIRSNTEKEVKEEAGLDVEVVVARRVDGREPDDTQQYRKRSKGRGGTGCRGRTDNCASRQEPLQYADVCV